MHSKNNSPTHTKYSTNRIVNDILSIQLITKSKRPTNTERLTTQQGLINIRHLEHLGLLWLIYLAHIHLLSTLICGSMANIIPVLKTNHTSIHHYTTFHTSLHNTVINKHSADTLHNTNNTIATGFNQKQPSAHN